MRSPAEYAADKNITPSGLVTGPKWFAENPQAAEYVRQMIADGYAHRQVHEYLRDEWGFPLKDEKSVKWALDAS